MISLHLNFGFEICNDNPRERRLLIKWHDFDLIQLVELIVELEEPLHVDEHIQTNKQTKTWKLSLS